VLGDAVKPRRLYPMKKINGINWKANVNTTQDIVRACKGKYASFGALVEIIDRYLATLEHVNKEEDEWLDAECIFCLEFLTSGQIGMTLWGHMFHRLCWLNHCMVLSAGQPQAPCPMCRTNVTMLCHGYPS
jgi:hypothetical protein